MKWWWFSCTSEHQHPERVYWKCGNKILRECTMKTENQITVNHIIKMIVFAGTLWLRANSPTTTKIGQHIFRLFVVFFPLVCYFLSLFFFNRIPKIKLIFKTSKSYANILGIIWLAFAQYAELRSTNFLERVQNCKQF